MVQLEGECEQDQQICYAQMLTLALPYHALNDIHTDIFPLLSLSPYAHTLHIDGS